MLHMLIWCCDQFMSTWNNFGPGYSFIPLDKESGQERWKYNMGDLVFRRERGKNKRKRRNENICEDPMGKKKNKEQHEITEWERKKEKKLKNKHSTPKTPKKTQQTMAPWPKGEIRPQLQRNKKCGSLTKNRKTKKGCECWWRSGREERDKEQRRNCKRKDSTPIETKNVPP